MMLTAKEIASRLVSLPRMPATAGTASRSPANQEEIDDMWSEITDNLNASGAAERLVLDQRLMFDRVRHWTREGLLSPAGAKNPGTGRARLYDESAVRKARVLNSLTECGVTVRNLHVISNFLDSKAAEWLTKTAGYYDLVYLVIQKFRGIEERDMQIRHLTRGDNMPELMFGKTVEYAIVVDLTQ
jgi:hypothetical protein